MSEHLSRERVGLALLAVALAGTVKAFVHMRGTEPTPQKQGGWTELDFSNTHQQVPPPKQNVI